MLGTIVVIILILFLVGALPTWPHKQELGLCPDWYFRDGPDSGSHPVPPWAAVIGLRESTRSCTGQGCRWLASIGLMVLC